MKCPKCGYHRQSRDDAFAPPTECPACGIVYAKYGPSGTAAEPPQGHPAAVKKPSPVDASTLRKARERVESRLRKKTGAPSTQNDQRDQTLKRARTLAAEGVRKRQQEWQHRQAVEGAAPAASLHEESAAPSETAAPQQAMTILADHLLAPTEPAAPQTSPPTEDEMSSTAHPAPEWEDTLPEAPILAEADAPSQATAIRAPETTLHAPAADNAVTEESHGVVLGARQDQESQPEDGPAQENARGEAGDLSNLAAMPAEAFQQFPEVKPGTHMRLFQVVAWLILLAGVVGAVLSWISLRDVQAGTQTPWPMGTGNLPMALLLGFAYLATGVLGFAFFWVTSLIGGQLAEIRGILLKATM